jgi:hypothetical protein
MAWNTLPTLSDGGTPTATNLNQINENMEWLKAPPTISFQDTIGSDYTTTSATWGTVSADFVGTLVTTGGYVEGLFSGSVRRLDLDWSVNGTRVTSTGTAGTGMFRNNQTLFVNTNLPYMWDNLPAGTYVFAMQWKVPAVVTGAIEGAYKPRFYVREL